MIVNEEDALARLRSPDNLANKLVEYRELHSNRTGPKNIPPMIQTLAVETGILTTQKAAAETFNIAQQTVSYYENGGGKADRNKIKEDISNVHSNALDAMLESIKLLKPKLEHVKKATDLSRIASDLGKVIDKTTPKQIQNNTAVKVVVFQPSTKVEDDYEEMIVAG